MKEVSAPMDGLLHWQFRYRFWFTGKYYPMREESCFVLGTARPVLRPMASEPGRRLHPPGTIPPE